ncbi:MAG TPA: DUF5114 domain-containing protein [Bacteroidales bacterium]|nr:DUF5114 domain-containing protein [Bacteroidales bacterium]
MKTKIFIIAICSLAIFTACEKDGLFLKVFGLDSSDLQASESEVILTKDNNGSQVLALSWSKSDLSVSDENIGIPASVPYEIIEVSAANDFENSITLSPQGNTYAFTGASLNTLAKNLGFTAGVSSPMYFRINTALGTNTEPKYSNTVMVDVTCFSIDMSLGFILNADHEDTGFRLYSPESNGEYSGFTGVTSWFNWYLLEGDGTEWGNLGIDGNAFRIANDESKWNFWYPGLGGCYYTTLSITDEQWTATYIPSLEITGDITMAMTFDRQAVKWYASFTTTGNNATIKVSGIDAKLYNASTSTDDAAAITKSIGFVPQTDSSLTFEWNSSSAGNITVPEAGDYTLTFFLADPRQLKFQLKPGKTVVVEPISKYLYLPGIDDGISGSWTFDNYLTLLSEDDSTFAGAVQVNSLWGYQMGLISGDWENVYKMASNGVLSFKSGSNIAAPAAGFYLIKADLKNLTYSHTAITSLSYAGFNDDWNMTTMDASNVTGVYTKPVTIGAASQWGFKLYLNGGWDDFYGGADGTLIFGGSGITDDAGVVAGSYDLVADIIGQRYALLGEKIYIGGLNDIWDFSTVVLDKTSAGVYKGTATITTASSWGIKIYPYKDNWDAYFGGSFTSMVFKGDNITDDQSLAAGTYDVTIDFINNTCTFEAQ